MTLERAEQLAGCKPTDGQKWARKTQQWVSELKEAGWSALEAHANPSAWQSPEGQWFTGTFYAWCVMKGEPL